MEVRLVLIEGGKPTTLSPRLPTVIGRNTQADVQVPDSQVSRRHCELYDYEGQLAVRDLGSVNGTLVNQHRIEQDTFLSTGDTLTIGKVTFEVEVEAADAEALPPAEQAAGAPRPATAAPAAAANEPAEVTSEAETAGSSGQGGSAVLNYETSDDGGSFIGISEEQPADDAEPQVENEAEADEEDDEDDGLADFLAGLN